MKLESLLEVLHAAHHTWLVESPWEERGGILLVAPPGQLKTTLVYTLNSYAEACCTGDMNIISMKSLRNMVLGGRYKTLAFGEMEKLYARNPNTAANIESHLKQFVEEGLRHFSHEDSATPIMPARCFVVAGITPSAYGRMYTAWEESGFSRRFLRIQYVLKDEKQILDAIHKWEKILFDLPVYWNGNRAMLKYNLDEKESKWILGLMKEQPNSTPSVLIKRVAVVLKYKRPKDWRVIFKDVEASFGKQGALLEL